MEDEDFYLEIAYALSACQLVEQQLKLYISEALELAQKCINNKIPFKMSGLDYENSSLERLIEVFKKLNDNKELFTDLERFKTERNFLSHKGITHCLDYEGELFLPIAEKFNERLVAIQKEARRLYHAIHVEANKFRGHLWFDDLTTG